MVLVDSLCSYSGNARNSPDYDHYHHRNVYLKIAGKYEREEDVCE